MDQAKVPEINLTSDSEDLIDDFWFTSPNTSFDGASLNSIPWADDVVKQNQELWERVERMFYGEESLPTNDIKLRNEMIEWTKHFPYLRVAGQQISIYFSNNVIPSDPNYEEVIAIHPPPTYFERGIYGAHRFYDEEQQFQDDSMAVNGNLAEDIEKCLRITSGPLLSRRMQNSRTAHIFRSTINPNDIDTNYSPQRIQNRNNHELKSALVSVRSNYDVQSQFVTKLYSSVDIDRLHTVPYSARLIKIPTLKSAIVDQSTTTATPNMIRIKTATLVPISRPLRNSITLPAINIEPKYFDQVYKSTCIRSALSPMKIIKKRSASE